MAVMRFSFPSVRRVPMGSWEPVRIDVYKRQLISTLRGLYAVISSIFGQSQCFRLLVIVDDLLLNAVIS